jgi:hypothetical protein
MLFSVAMKRASLHACGCLATLVLASMVAFGQGAGLPARGGHWIDHLEPASFAQRNDIAPITVYGTGFINPTSCPARVELQNLAQGTVAALPAEIESGTKITAIIPASIAGAPGAYAVTVRFYTACGYGVIEESRLSNAARLDIIRTDYTAPDTVIVSAPTGSTSMSAVFEFSGSDDFTQPDRLAFQCRVDGDAPMACPSRSVRQPGGGEAHAGSARHRSGGQRGRLARHAYLGRVERVTDTASHRGRPTTAPPARPARPSPSPAATMRRRRRD